MELHFIQMKCNSRIYLNGLRIVKGNVILNVRGYLRCSLPSQSQVRRGEEIHVYIFLCE